ncbi:MAG TPA: DNA polymerase III subunit gamma/tau [Gemmatimonadota bacterium]|nr:DNA polymerase III subunit gamma/tau [Gemmatimonadota bacterium]
MPHQPLALKYRPGTFGDVISQEHVTRTLRNALDQNRIAHAVLFAGPRGSGKTTTARILAKALNCEAGVSGEPCGRCENCRTIAAGRSLDVIEIDAASNRGIDDIKELRETVKYAPAQGRYKVYIVDEVHQLSKDAFNAFLKTLEEPPRNVVFVLATTEPHKIPPTILSRCQRFDFRPIPLKAIRERLAWIAEREGIRLGEPAAWAIAKKADGSLRDALSLLDQVVAFGGEDVDLGALRGLIGMPDEERYLELTGLLADGDAGAALVFARDLRASGYDLEEFYAGFLEHLRSCLLAALGSEELLEDVPERLRDAYREAAARLGTEDLLRMLTLATDEEETFRRSSQQALVLEVLLIRLALLDRMVDVEAALAALDGGDGGPAPAGRAADRRSAGRSGRPARDAPGSGNARATAAAVPSGPITLEALLERWDEVVEAVHLSRPTVAALLRGARPAVCSAEEVVLTVPPEAEFRMEQLHQRGTLDPLAAVLNQRWSFAGKIRVTGSTPGESAAAPARGRPNGRDLAEREMQARLEGDPLLRRVVDLFDARVVRVQGSSPAQP